MRSGPGSLCCFNMRQFVIIEWMCQSMECITVGIEIVIQLPICRFTFVMLHFVCVCVGGRGASHVKFLQHNLRKDTE